MKKFILIGLFSSCLFSSVAYAAAIDVLQNRLAKIESLSARFSQVITSADKVIVQETQGELAIKRPNYFLWKTTGEELSELISDGKTVWNYTPQLQQVTATHLADLSNNILLLMISDDQNKIWSDYTIGRKGDHFILTPKNKEEQSFEIDVLATGMISSFALIESDGQRNFYRLDQQSLKLLSSDTFRFIIPEGVTLDDQRS